jgi:hypothetical protein
MNSKCVNLQTISRYISGNLDEQSIASVELHLADCSRCREQVVLSQDMIQDSDLRAEYSMTESQASQIIENLHLTPGLIETCVTGIQTIKKSIQRKWLELKDQWTVGMSPKLAFAPVKVRSGESWDRSVKRLRIPLHDNYIDCVIQKAGKGLCHLSLKVVSINGKATNCRLLLTDVTGKSMSRLSCNCEIQFENIPCGECRLTLFQDGAPAGATQLYTGHFLP